MQKHHGKQSAYPREFRPHRLAHHRMAAMVP
jgi:hypothetical protein